MAPSQGHGRGLRALFLIVTGSFAIFVAGILIGATAGALLTQSSICPK